MTDQSLTKGARRAVMNAMSPRRFFLLLALLSSVSCGSNRGQACDEGTLKGCLCPDGTMSTQACVGGAYAACSCGGGPAMCGNSICEKGETCLSCVDDCGACPACNAAPSCTDAVGVPANPSARDDLDIGEPVPDGGVPAPKFDASNCGDPQLRLRVASITASSGGGQLYCIVHASDGATSEFVLTTKTQDLGDNQTGFFDPTVGVFWGQQMLKPTTNNLTITYDCFHVGSDAWSKALMAASMAANQAGGIAGVYGWAFGAAAVAAAAAGAAVMATSGDDHRMNAQQTIDRQTLIDLTNGRKWRIHQSGGCGLFCNWNWTLTVEAWGCAKQKAPPPM